jgi:hypothetical protein
MNERITPITRNNKYYSEEDFQRETSIVEEYFEEDLNQTVIVYEVDRAKTNMNTVYKEKQNNLRYKAPKEIPCMFEIKPSEIKSYDSKTSNGVYAVSGSLEFYVLVKTLEKYKCDIHRGDYVGVPIEQNRMSYFVVVNDGKVNTSNDQYIGAYKPAFYHVVCSPCTESEFNAR